MTITLFTSFSVLFTVCFNSSYLFFEKINVHTLACQTKRSSLLVQSNNPFLDEKLNVDVQNQFGGNNMILYQSQCLRLPASSPYDHFLKAAGC